MEGRISASILSRPDNCFNRAVYKSMGYSDADLSKPMIGVANTWSELVPGSCNLRALAGRVKQGICAAGGTPFEFGVIGCCDGTGQGNEGMKFMLPSRDIIANDVEVMIRAHSLDGVILLGSCDKIVPGLMMAAARLDIPAILLPGGPMLGGPVFDGRKSDLTTMSEGCGMLRAGRLSEQELYSMENKCGPTCGSCSFYGTANTMCCLSEALGLTVPGGALVPAVYAERTRIAFESGERIVELVKRNITAGQIMTEASLENAIAVLNATGGSTNAVMHLTAVARELGIESGRMMELFERMNKQVPLVAKVNPASKYNMEDFCQAGGIPQVMREIRPVLHLDAMTVTGKTVGENLDSYPYEPPDREIIKTMVEPFAAFGGVAVLRGNLAPEGCVTKPSAIDPAMHVFSGRARVFDSEEAAEEVILAGGIRPGDVLVIRYEGPKGGPGMREMYKAMKYLYGMGLARQTAIVTDGRFSGTNNGCFVGHISPEAAEGGVIALVEDGDHITIDIPGQQVTLHVDEGTLAVRRGGWTRPREKYHKGYMALYERCAASASRGAVLEL